MKLSTLTTFSGSIATTITRFCSVLFSSINYDVVSSMIVSPCSENCARSAWAQGISLLVSLFISLSLALYALVETLLTSFLSTLLSSLCRLNPEPFTLLSTYYRLKVNEKVLPLFSPADLTEIYPLFIWTKFWQIMSPIPMPSLFVSAVRSSLPNFWNSWPISSSLIPFPESMTWQCSIYSISS